MIVITALTTKRRSLLSATLVIALGLCLSARGFAAGVDDAQPDIRRIVEHVRASTGNLPQRLRFRQDVEVRLAFLQWNFETEVERDENGVHYRLFNPPPFLPEELTGDLVDVADALHQFDLTFMRTETDARGDVLYVLSGQRRPGVEGGAESGVIWVHRDSWQVRKVVAEYSWGRLEVDQTYQSHDGYTVLATQRATVYPWKAELTVIYRDYDM